jgi:hypothetical protein
MRTHSHTLTGDLLQDLSSSLAPIIRTLRAKYSLAETLSIKTKFTPNEQDLPAKNSVPPTKKQESGTEAGTQRDSETETPAAMSQVGDSSRFLFLMRSSTFRLDPNEEIPASGSPQFDREGVTRPAMLTSLGLFDSSQSRNRNPLLLERLHSPDVRPERHSDSYPASRHANPVERTPPATIMRVKNTAEDSPSNRNSPRNRVYFRDSPQTVSGFHSLAGTALSGKSSSSHGRTYNGTNNVAAMTRAQYSSPAPQHYAQAHTSPGARSKHATPTHTQYARARAQNSNGNRTQTPTRTNGGDADMRTPGIARVYGRGGIHAASAGGYVFSGVRGVQGVQDIRALAALRLQRVWRGHAVRKVRPVTSVRENSECVRDVLVYMH